MSTAPTIVFVEHVVWQPDDAWTEALEHLASRFARSGTALDLDAITAAGPLHAQLDALAAWATEAGAKLDQELGRYLDEHLSMHVRPDPRTTRAVRALAADAPVHAASALPPRAAESLLRHAGCWRSVTELHGDVRDAPALAALLEQTGASTVIAAGSTPLPQGTLATPLATPA